MGYALLTSNQAKMALSLELGYYSTILQLQPAMKYKGLDTCPWAGQCKGFCLQHTGHNRFDRAEEARKRRTRLLADRPTEFMALLCSDIESAQRKATREGLRLTVRLNGLSDLDWRSIPCLDSQNVFQRFHDVIFIDYTKSIERAFESLDESFPKNYTLVYSYNEKSVGSDVSEYLDRGGRVAVVFDTKKGAPLPLTYSVGGYEYSVTDGDISDLRHLDPKGYVIGLRYKQAYSDKTGKAIKPKRGFIILGAE